MKLFVPILFSLLFVLSFVCAAQPVTLKINLTAKKFDIDELNNAVKGKDLSKSDIVFIFPDITKARLNDFTFHIGRVTINGSNMDDYYSDYTKLKIDNATGQIAGCGEKFNIKCDSVKVPFDFSVDKNGSTLISIGIGRNTITQNKVPFTPQADNTFESTDMPGNTKIESSPKGVSPYDDAVKLTRLPAGFSAKNIDTVKQNIADVLNKYLRKNYVFDSLKFAPGVKGNNYLIDYINLVKEKIDAINKKTLTTSKTITEGQSVQGVPTDMIGLPTALADGVAKFMAKRFREELTASFFREFKKQLCDNKEKFKGLDTLFPQTRNILCSMDPYAYNTFLPALRNAFERDFINSPQNLRNFLAVYLKDVPEKDKPMLAYVLTGLDLINLFQQKNGKPELILDNLDNREYIKAFPSLDIVLQNTLALESILSRNSKDLSGNYINTSDWAVLLQNADHRRLYLGLVLLREQTELTSIKFKREYKPTDLYQFINDSVYQHDLLADLMVRRIEGIGKQIDEIKIFINTRLKDDKRISRLTADDWFELAGYSLDIVDSASVMLGYFYGNNNKIAPAVAGFRNNVSFVRELNRAAMNKEWGIVLGNMLQAAYKTVPAIKDNEELYSSLTRYGGFMVAVLSARNSDDVDLALESAALPVGSWRMNRENTFNITINSYAGGMLSYTHGWFKSKSNWDFLGSVGLNLTCNFNNFAPGLRNSNHFLCNALGWLVTYILPHTVHVPVADLGPIVNLRLNNPGAVLPELKWADLFSPGIYGVWGIPGIPISLGWGGQYAPQYSIGTPGPDNPMPVILRNKWRWNIFAAVDIPIFGIYSVR